MGEAAALVGEGASNPNGPNHQLDVFACNIDESVGHAELLEADHRATQLTELPGHTLEDIFK